MLVGP